MARRYAVAGSATNGTNKTVLAVTAATTTRARIYDLSLSASGTPADSQAAYLVQRYTAAGTATAVTPQAIDPAEPAASCSAGKAHSAEPTYTANAILLELGLNMRNAFRWVAIPGCELVIPATASNGIGVYSTAASTAFVTEAVIHFEE